MKAICAQARQDPVVRFEYPFLNVAQREEELVRMDLLNYCSRLETVAAIEIYGRV